MSQLDLPAGPWVVGHRGAAGEALENTLSAAQRAVACGVAMIEVDLRLTADRVLVVFHDRTLERLAGRSGEIERMHWRSLGRIRLGPSGARIPRLADLLAAVPARMPLNLELKRDRASRHRLAESLIAELARRRRTILVSSFDWRLLAAVRDRSPGLALAPISVDDRPGLVAAGADLDAWSLHCHHALADRRLVAAAEPDGRPVLAYTVNQPGRARTLLRRGVRGVFTDRPTALLAALARWPV